ncbi:MAG TPA: efflux RND transporter periplasmic adaptor subunit [Nannocystaceae bacterium]|nr:efflux RND transporter periplasmic adaptor subunit [Nannocystaceae bacterium]
MTDARVTPERTSSTPNRRRWPWLFAGLAIVLGVASFALDRSANGDEAPPASPMPDVPRIVDGRIQFSEAYARRIGMRVAAVELREVRPAIHVAGTVAVDPRRTAAIGARIQGRVTDVEVVEGDRVDAGAMLARMESAELGDAQADVMSLQARAEAAARDRDRKELLVEEGIASRRSAQQIEAEHASLQAQLDAAQQRVRALGGRPTRRRLGRFELRSPIAGEVVGVHVQRGQSIDSSHTAFHVADLATVWVELALFERDLWRVEVGDVVAIEPYGEPTPPLEGVVAHVARVLDPSTRTAAVRVEVDNSSHRVAIGQAVRARVHAGRGALTAPALPRDAVVLLDGSPTVFVEVGDRVVEPRAVEVAVEGDQDIAIASGVAPGERVVVAGMFELKSELFR